MQIYDEILKFRPIGFDGGGLWNAVFLLDAARRMSSLGLYGHPILTPQPSSIATKIDRLTPGGFWNTCRHFSEKNNPRLARHLGVEGQRKGTGFIVLRMISPKITSSK